MEPFRFHTPCSILVVGSSGCGKTVFVDHLLQQMKNNFDRPIHKVVYCHGVWQDHFNNMQARGGIKFHEGLPSDDLGNIFPPSQRPGLLILDDLMSDAGQDRTVLDLFTKELITRILLKSTFDKTCFHLENMPKPFQEKLITSWRLKTLEIN